MKKTLCYLLLLVLPFMMVFTTIFISKAKGPYWVGMNHDPDYAYLLNSLNLARMKGVGHIDHPGTTVQVSGAIVLRAVHLFSSSSETDLQTKVLKDPEFYLSIIRNVFMGLNTLILIILGLITYRLTNDAALSIIVQLSPFIPSITATFLYGLTAVRPESFLLLASLLFTIIIILYGHTYSWKINHDHSNPGNTPELLSPFSFMIYFSIVSGFGLATKTTFLPLLVIPIIILPSYRNKAQYVMGTFFSFIFFTIPVISEYKRLFSGMFSIITHFGTHGKGMEKIIEPEVYLSNINQLLRLEYVFSIILITAISILLIGYTLSKFRKLSIGNINFRLLSGITLSQMLGVLMVAKHFRGWELYYLLPVSSLSGVALMLIIYCLRDAGNAFKSNASKSPSLRNPGNIILNFSMLWIVVIIITFISIAKTSTVIAYSDIQSKVTNQRMNVYHKAEMDYKDYAKIYYLGTSAPAFALSLGDVLAKGYNAEYLKKIYPDVYIYVPWYRKYYYWDRHEDDREWKQEWNNEVPFNEILTKHGTKLIFQGPVFKDLLSEFSGDSTYSRVKIPDLQLIDILQDKIDKIPGESRETIYEIVLSPES